MQKEHFYGASKSCLEGYTRSKTSALFLACVTVAGHPGQHHHVRRVARIHTAAAAVAFRGGLGARAVGQRQSSSRAGAAAHRTQLLGR